MVELRDRDRHARPYRKVLLRMQNDNADKNLKKNRQKLRGNGLNALRTEIETTENGKVRARGLGVFIIKTLTKEVDGQTVTTKRIKLRLGSGKARKLRPAPPETSSEDPASEHDI
jgi:hypothetical protein